MGNILPGILAVWWVLAFLVRSELLNPNSLPASQALEKRAYCYYDGASGQLRPHPKAPLTDSPCSIRLSPHLSVRLPVLRWQICGELHPRKRHLLRHGHLDRVVSRWRYLRHCERICRLHLPERQNGGGSDSVDSGDGAHIHIPGNAE